MTVGERIRQRRLELGLTQTQLANRLGNKSKVSVCTVEKDREDLTTDRIRKYAKALECTPGYLLGLSDSPTQPPLFDVLTSINLDKNKDNALSKQKNQKFSISEEEWIIIECYRALQDGEKEMARRLLNYYERLKEYADDNNIQKP